MLQIKFCGMTRREDVREALRLGVDAVGVVFYERSPRQVTIEQARQLFHDMPPWVIRVGVFVEPTADQVADIALRAGLTAVQLYGGPTAEELTALGCQASVIHAIHAGANLPEKLAVHADDAVLIDAPAQVLPGGTGHTWDWSLIAGAPRPRQVWLAGGLNAANVHEAVTRVRPDVVDVSSGVECAPGIKDKARMAAFVAACAPFRRPLQERL